jgi:hypothetical protein
VRCLSIVAVARTEYALLAIARSNALPVPGILLDGFGARDDNQHEDCSDERAVFLLQIEREPTIAWAPSTVSPVKTDSQAEPTS